MRCRILISNAAITLWQGTSLFRSVLNFCIEAAVFWTVNWTVVACHCEVMFTEMLKCSWSTGHIVIAFRFARLEHCLLPIIQTYLSERMCDWVMYFMLCPFELKKNDVYKKLWWWKEFGKLNILMRFNSITKSGPIYRWRQRAFSLYGQVSLFVSTRLKVLFITYRSLPIRLFISVCYPWD